MRMNVVRTAGFVLFTVFISGCAIKVPVFEPEFVSEEFDVKAINEITIIPVVDVRFDESEVIDDLTKEMLFPTGWNTESSGVIPQMEQRGYRVVYSKYYSVKDITRDDIENVEVDWIRKLGAGGDRWVMLIALEDLTSSGGFGVSFSAQCKGMLFDTEEGTVIWKHKDIAKVEFGGLIVMALSGMARTEVTWRCAVELYYRFPLKKES